MPAAVAFRVEPISTAVDLIVSDTLSLEAQKKAVAQFARARLAEVQQQHRQQFGHEPDYTRAVDGRLGAMEEEVNVPGRIVYAFSVWRPVLQFTFDILRRWSPRRSGRYQRSFVALLNWDEIDIMARGIPDNAEIIVVNTQPYSRKIHVGAMKMSVPPGLFETAKLEIQRQFRGVVRARVTFIQLKDGYVLKGRGARGLNPRSARARRVAAGQPMTYPAIALRLN